MVVTSIFVFNFLIRQFNIFVPKRKLAKTHPILPFSHGRESNWTLLASLFKKQHMTSGDGCSVEVAKLMAGNHVLKLSA